MSVKLSSQNAGRQMAADLAAVESAKIGAAAERKRRQESSDSIAAVLASDGKGGRAVYWHRRVRGSDGQSRESLEVERSGAYSPRAFLRMAEKAAAQAGKGRWNRPEAIEAVAAELVARTMAKTGGRMPKAGSLGRQATGHENPDLAYLTATARQVIAAAIRGDDAGLASEAAPSGDDSESDRAGMSLAELAAESEAAAEGPRDPYLSDPLEPGADLLNQDTREAAAALALIIGERPAAIMAAIVAAFRRPLAKSDDLADAGYATSPASARKAAQRGREILARALDLAPVAQRSDAEAELARAVACLCENEDTDRAPRHYMEENPHGVYRRPKIEWPLVPREEKIAPVVTYTATEPEWRTA